MIAEWIRKKNERDFINNLNTWASKSKVNHKIVSKLFKMKKKYKKISKFSDEDLRPNNPHLTHEQYVKNHEEHIEGFSKWAWGGRYYNELKDLKKAVGL